MAWIEVHQTLARHPKLIRLSAKLRIHRAQSAGHLLFLWLWTLDYAPTGDLSAFGPAEISAAADYPGDAENFAQALKETGWIDEDDFLHDWMDYAGRLIEKRSENKDRQKRFRDRTRIPIYNRDGGMCCYCGKPVPISEFYVDHILPVARGGNDDAVNLATSCNSCNIKKGGRTPEDAGMPLRNALRTGATVPNLTVPNQEEKKKEKEKEKPKSPASPPVFFSHEFFSVPDFLPAWVAWQEMRKKLRKPATTRAQEVAFEKLLILTNGDARKAIRIVNNAIERCWLTFYPEQEEKNGTNRKTYTTRSERLDRDAAEFLREFSGNQPGPIDPAKHPQNVHFGGSSNA